MQFSESWLRRFTNPPISTAELAEVLTMAGLEVEEQRPAAAPFSGVVVAQVQSVQAHPNADKLRVCKVQVSATETLTIVCGAPNVQPGIKVPCALVGAQLPPDAEGKSLLIKVGKLRGVESFGMLCSGRELGLPQDTDGLLVLPDDAAIGTSLRDYLNLDDTVFVIKLTPDKGHCLSVLGVARELAAATGAALNLPTFSAAPVTLNETLPVQISAPDLCGRFSGRVIRGVNAKAATPLWMKQDLERAGQRSISALVDISNYVMLELGRPSHIFDLDKLQSGLTVRWGKAGETLKLLNDNKVEIDDKVGVIADQAGVQALAGIMGGDATAVSLDTQNIYLEAAFWWPDAIRGRARRYNFSTDAGHRFERGVDYATTVEHLERITQLILDICGGQVGPVDDQAPNLPQRKPVALRVSRAAKVLGIPVTSEQCSHAFTRLGLPFEQHGDVFTVTPPSYRFDLEIEEDLIEEIARIHGYDAIPVRPPLAPQPMKYDREGQRSLHDLRDLLVASDYQETINYTFIEPAWEQDFAGNSQPLKLLNPIASHLSVMRSSLIGSLVQVLRYNLNRRADRVRLFEIGRAFLRDASVKASLSSLAGIAQPMRVAGLAYGSAQPDQWGITSKPVDFFDVKADVEKLCAASGALRFEAIAHPAFHPGRSARVWLNDQAIGWLGELHPQWQQKYELPQAPVLFELDASALQIRQMPKVQESSKFPAVRRDIAVVVDDKISAAQVLDCLHTSAAKSAYGQLLQDLTLFDQYRGKGLSDSEKSLAFRLVLQDTAATLQDTQADALVQDLIQGVQTTLGGRLR